MPTRPKQRIFKVGHELWNWQMGQAKDKGCGPIHVSNSVSIQFWGWKFCKFLSYDITNSSDVTGRESVTSRQQMSLLEDTEKVETHAVGQGSTWRWSTDVRRASNWTMEQSGFRWRTMRRWCELRGMPHVPSVDDTIFFLPKIFFSLHSPINKSFSLNFGEKCNMTFF